jgi:hypothetical protein
LLATAQVGIRQPVTPERIRVAREVAAGRALQLTAAVAAPVAPASMTVATVAQVDSAEEARSVDKAETALVGLVDLVDKEQVAAEVLVA